jgi:hypothetical protein
MKDADRPADISLDADKLEQLLEVPAPAQPVVMIEYRNRGVPWWLLVTLIVVVPLVAVVVYQQVIVERYAAAASKANYDLAKAKVADNNTPVAEEPRTDPMPVERASPPAAAPVVISAQAAPQPEAPEPGSPPSPSEPKAAPASAEKKVDAPALASAGEPPESRVRSIFPIQLEGAANAPEPKSAGAGSPRPASAAQDRTTFEEPIGADPALSQPSRAVSSGPGEGRPTDNGTTEPIAVDPAAGSVDPASHPQTIPPVQPLPTADEMRRQLAQESAEISARKAEEPLEQNDRQRVRRYENRVLFHDELRVLLNGDLKRAGEEIDALARRRRGDTDPRNLAKARAIWRRGQVPLATRVNQIRALDVSECDILNFMSDNLFALMHAKGGPRDSNDLRVRAARQLLSCKLPGATAPAAAGSEASTPPLRNKNGADPPR